MSFQSRVLRFLGFGSGARRLWILTTRQWLWIGIFASIVYQSALSVAYYMEFSANIDLGVVNQSMSSASQGSFFFNTQAYATRGLPSLLSIHFSWVYFAMVPLYDVFPLATTLFAVQTVALAAGAIPLYYLATDVTRSEVKGVATAAMYLVWAPIYSANPWTSHVEPFLPLLFFGTFLLFYRAKYLPGLALGTLAAFTLDGMQVFVALTGVFFLSFPLQAVIALWWQKRRQARQNSTHRPATLSARVGWVWLQLKALLRLRSTRASLALIAIGVAAFFAMRLLEVETTTFLGSPSYALGVTRLARTGFGLNYLGYQTWTKTEFWLVVLATVCFLPFLSPRSTLILLAPWVLYTYLLQDLTFVTFSNPHIDVAAFPLFVGVAFAMRRFRFGSGPPESRNSKASTLSSFPGGNGRPQNSPPTNGNRGSARLLPSSKLLVVLSIAVVVTILLANIAINPGDPLAEQDRGVFDKSPFGARAYQFSWTPPSGFSDVVRMSKLVPNRASAVASVELWPLLSFDRNAYPDGQSLDRYTIAPFNGTVPDFVFTYWDSVGQGELHAYPFSAPYNNTSLENLVWNSSAYGVRAWIQSTVLGPVFLFEQGYSGPVETFGSVSYPSNHTYSAGGALYAGPAGNLSKVKRGIHNVSAITSEPDKTGLVWTATSSTTVLPPGSYTILLNVELTGPGGNCSAANLSPNAPVLTVNYGESLKSLDANRTIDFGDVPCGSWSAVSLPIDLSYPLGGFGVEGNRPAPMNGLTIEIESVAILAND